MPRSRFLALAASVLMFAFALVGTPAGAQQDKSKRPSPPGTATFSFDDGGTITVNYSRPKINDPRSGQPRKIYGGLVPYGQVWRAGANEATSFVTQSNLTVGNMSVPAGSYTLYILPQQNSPWQLIISKKTGQWGIPYPGQQDDLARINMKIERTPSTVQDFTISFDKLGPKAGVLKFDWENTSASVDFSEANK